MQKYPYLYNMDVLFLDIDGVLNSEAYAEKLEKEQSTNYEEFLDQEAVQKLVGFLTDKPNLRIVLSSSWRYRTFSETYNYLKTTGLAPLLHYIVAITPWFSEGTRGDEIDGFLRSIGNVRSDFLWKDGKRFNIDNYVIIDDDDDMLEKQMPHFVKTDYRYGLTDEDYEKVKTILGYV